MCLLLRCILLPCPALPCPALPWVYCLALPCPALGLGLLPLPVNSACPHSNSHGLPPLPPTGAAG